MEWLYPQQVTEEDPTVHSALEFTILHELIPNFFGEDKTDDMRRELLSNPIPHGGDAITNPITTAPVNLHTSEVCTVHIFSALMKKSTFNHINHQHVMAAG